MTAERTVDLHTHSLCSDGTLSAHEVVQLAKQAGLAAVAITDHDTVAGIAEAISTGHALQIEVVPGVEISTVAREQDIHVLGYFINYDDETLLSRLEQLRKTRDRRNEMMIEKLRQLGVEITLDEVIEHLPRPLADNETIGRPHIAEVLVSKGYVDSLAQAFEQYLGKTGAAYVNPPRISPEEAICWIHEAGGAAVLAHPGLYDDDKLVLHLIASGLDGLEAYHSDHSPLDEQKYLEMARTHELIVTAGSDFHGERGGHIFHGPIGSKATGIDVIEQLRQSALSRRT